MRIEQESADSLVSLSVLSCRQSSQNLKSEEALKNTKESDLKCAKAEPRKNNKIQKWDKEAENRLKYLSMRGVSRKIQSVVLGRESENVFSKI